MGKMFKDKEKPTEDQLVRAVEKNFPVDIELEAPMLIYATRGHNKKGIGVTLLAFKIHKCWSDDKGNLVAFIEPDSKMIEKKLDRYGDEIVEKGLGKNV